MIKIKICRIVLAFAAALATVAVASEPSGNAARVVAWQPKEGMTREFELGYQRHLEWHRAQNDPWTWHGWSIVSGPRTGYFVDGTFFHRWTDFDVPVAPREDAADNATNVVPYATLHSVAAYETVPSLSRFEPSQLTAPLLMFTYIEVAPGRGEEFEAALAARARDASSTTSFAFLRPAVGSHEYLLLQPAQLQSELAAHAAFVDRVLASVVRKEGGRPIVKRLRSETGRYRPDLSYVSRPPR